MTARLRCGSFVDAGSEHIADTGVELVVGPVACRILQGKIERELELVVSPWPTKGLPSWTTGQVTAAPIQEAVPLQRPGNRDSHGSDPVGALAGHHRQHPKVASQSFGDLAAPQPLAIRGPCIWDRLSGRRGSRRDKPAPRRWFPQPASRCARPGAVRIFPGTRAILVPASPALCWCPPGTSCAPRAGRWCGPLSARRLRADRREATAPPGPARRP